MFDCFLPSPTSPTQDGSLNWALCLFSLGFVKSFATFQFKTASRCISPILLQIIWGCCLQFSPEEVFHIIRLRIFTTRVSVFYFCLWICFRFIQWCYSVLLIILLLFQDNFRPTGNKSSALPKNQALTLNRYSKDAANFKKKTFLCPFNADPFSCYQTTLQMICWCPLLQCVGKEVLFVDCSDDPLPKVRLRKGKLKGMSGSFSPSPNWNYGKYYINNSLEEIVKICRYTNFQHFTAHDKQHACLSTDANFGVLPDELMQMVGHSVIIMVATYHKPNQTA